MSQLEEGLEEEGQVTPEEGNQQETPSQAADPRPEIEVISPIYHPCGDVVYKVLPETCVDAIKLAEGISLREHLNHLSGTVAKASSVRFAQNLVERDLITGAKAGDRVYVLDASADPNVKSPQPVMYIMLPNGRWSQVGQVMGYQVGELYHFLNPHPRPGMVPVYGTVIANVSQRYPEAWEYFQTAEGQAMCVTEEEWQEMSNAVYWTSTGAQVEFGPTDPVPHSWDGIGGAPAFVLDLEQDSLRVPDMRGMFAETTGGPGSAEIGRAKHDHIRGMRGLLDPGINWLWPHPFTGLFTRSGDVCAAKNFTSLPDYDINSHSGARYMTYNNGHNIPVGAVVAPRRYGVLSCVYLGLPGQVQEEDQAGNQEEEQEVEA